MHTKLKIKGAAISVSCGLLLTPPAMAGFATYAKNWPDGPEVVNERVVDIEGSDKLKPPKEQECLEDTYGTQKVLSDKGRLYAKLGINYLSTDVRDLRNISDGTFAGMDLTLSNAKHNYYSWEFGLGTTWKMLRVELEYVHTKETLYDPSPVVAGRSEILQSTVNNTSMLLNFFYDFDTFTYFKPYVGALWGVAWNYTRSTLIGGALGNNAAQNANYVTPLVWGFTVGGRVPFYERWRAYVQYRYTSQGRVNWASNTGGFRLKGQYMLSGFSLGVQYIF